MNIVASLVCGLIFGAGLVISGMTQPAKVLGFLDIFGRWDPTLAFVIAGAIAVSAAGFALARRAGAPVFAARHLWPTRKDIDRPLVAGALLFGVGWGLVGLCPGPAVVNIATLSPRLLLFVLAMIAGMALQGWRQSRADTTASRADGGITLAPTDG
ncbi:MAG: YeeE/YedE family protein [Alphaproteobacteria bacterium]|nr:YeeE/YedE family protein [Alphaproteobacteria bacterium]